MAKQDLTQRIKTSWAEYVHKRLQEAGVTDTVRKEGDYVYQEQRNRRRDKGFGVVTGQCYIHLNKQVGDYSLSMYLMTEPQRTIDEITKAPKFTEWLSLVINYGMDYDGFQFDCDIDGQKATIDSADGPFEFLKNSTKQFQDGSHSARDIVNKILSLALNERNLEKYRIDIRT